MLTQGLDLCPGLGRVMKGTTAVDKQQLRKTYTEFKDSVCSFSWSQEKMIPHLSGLIAPRSIIHWETTL